MQGSLEQFLGQIARRGSWLGGGSASALSAALAAALLEKLTTQAAAAGRLRRARRECVRLIEQDAACFARVIQAMRAGRRDAFVRSLKAAIEVPCHVILSARAVRRQALASKQRIARQFHSDVQCVIALSRAAEDGAAALVRTNLAWLGDRAYRQQIHRRLRSTR